MNNASPTTGEQNFYSVFIFLNFPSYAISKREKKIMYEIIGVVSFLAHWCLSNDLSQKFLPL